jgi:hypothetical protein
VSKSPIAPKPTEPKPEKRLSDLSDDEFLAKLDKAKPAVFPSVLTAKINTGTVTATMFNLINHESQRLATLTTTDDGRPGLAMFHPGSDCARIELMLEKDGPALRLNNAEGRQQLLLRLVDEQRPTLALFDSKGHPRIVLLLDHDRPHLNVLRRGARKRHVVVAVPWGEQPKPLAAWKRAMRAARANQREKFIAAAMDSGFLSMETDSLWTFVRRRLGEAPTTPEDTLSDAGISTKRQARYQRRLSSLLAGRE